MLQTIHRSRPAMGTIFEAWLVGTDDEHLTAVAEAVFDEIARVELLLSRFDPRSEVARLNRLAAREPVLVGFELLDVLLSCRAWWERTRGAFDPLATSPADAIRPTMADLEVDVEQRLVRFAAAQARLDLGGFGKGYALDRAAQILGEFGVASALVHGGASSVLARGTTAEGRPWPVGVGNPWNADGNSLAVLPLSDTALSTSVALAADGESSDIVDPRSGQSLVEQAACTVLAPSAADAEALSTAIVAMGKRSAAAYTQDADLSGCRIAWIDAAGATQSPQFTWLVA